MLLSPSSVETIRRVPAPSVTPVMAPAAPPSEPSKRSVESPLPLIVKLIASVCQQPKAGVASGNESLFNHCLVFNGFAERPCRIILMPIVKCYTHI